MDGLPRLAQMRIEPAAVGFMAYPSGNDDAQRIAFRQSLSTFVGASTDWMVYHCHRDGAGGWRSAHVVPFMPPETGDR